MGRVFARRPGGAGRPSDEVVTGKLEGALVDWGLYRDGVRDRRVSSYTEALDRARRGQGFVEFFRHLVDVWIDYMDGHPLERGVTAATTMELDPDVRRAVREPVHRLYAQGLRPLLDEAVTAGELSADTDVDALLSLLVLLLPHLALAPFEPGLDAALALHGTRGRARSEAAHRLVAALFAPHLSPRAGQAAARD